MAKIIIGGEYADEFGSIYRLFSGGFISDEINIKRAAPNLIETEKNTFIFSENEHGVNGSTGGGKSALGFSGEGATWFSSLRGGHTDSGNADWKQLIMDVAADFHKHYSLIEFRQTRRSVADGEEEKIKQRFVSGFLERVFPDGKQYSVSNLRGTRPENIYAVSMRLEINGGGESEPVLGKIYFRENAELGFVPVYSREAGQMDRYVEGAAPAESGSSIADIVDAALVTRVFAGLDSAFRSGKFAQYVLFNDKYKKEINEMLSQLATSEVKSLECTGVKVLGISHLEWESAAYDILCRGKSVLKLIIGLNGSVSLICTNCGGKSLLVDGNIIKFKGAAPDNCPTVLNFELENLGLISDDIKTLREKSIISEHLFEVRCPENPRNNRCAATVCLSQAVQIKADGKNVYKCRGCRYPEIIYDDVFGTGGKGRYTPSLKFAAERLALVSEETEKCACCGREFSKSALGRGRFCAFCAARPSESDTALYKKYSKILSSWVRLKHLFHKKYCRENDNILMFELGDERYIFDKLNITERGFIPKPVKFDRNGGAR